MPFTLEKWYLDLVTDDGTAVVGYVAGVTWHGLHLHFASTLVASRDTPPDERSALGAGAWPQLANDRLSWSAESLAVHGDWRALAAPIERTLLTSPAGDIEWTCVMPRAHGVVDTPAGRFEGIGYAERLRLTLPPWAFPFHALRWGRHVSDRHGLVWIEWDGDHALRAVWLDGELHPEAHVVAAGVAGLTNGRTLRWHASRDLTRRSVGATIARVSPVLAARVAGRLATMQEHKQLSASSLVDAAGHALDQGWAIHEVVTW